MLVVGEAPQLAGGLTAALSEAGYRVRHVLPGSQTRLLGENRFEANLAAPAGLAELRALLCDREQRQVGGVINCLALSEPFRRAGILDATKATEAVLWTFNVIQEFRRDLEETADTGGGVFVNLTGLDGQFGRGRGGSLAIAPAGTIGLVKAFQRESPRLNVISIDVHPELPPDLLVGRIVTELEFPSGSPEVGFTNDGRWQLSLQEVTAGDADPLASVINSDSVLLITGGADGITAEIMRGLAAEGSRLVIIGRTDLSADEPSELGELDTSRLRTHFLELARGSGKRVIPQELETSVQSVLKQRRLRGHLREFRAQGAAVEYHACDVRDTEKFTRLIADVYRRYGRIDGVIHAAGVIEDKRIRDKTLPSFRRVFETKVAGAIALAMSLQPEMLKFLAFFSSVAARFGNAGQADYCAANEYLNKLADHLDQTWPARVVSINWGPWEAGMVSDELRRLYASQGIGLIPVADGVRLFLEELGRKKSTSAEVVITCPAETMQRIRKG